MYNKLIEYANSAKAMLDECNIPISENITAFRLNGRLRSTWGRCRRWPDGHFEIELQKKMFENGSSEGIINTLIHELLHTCPGCFNHGKQWKKHAEIVKKRFGLNITRTDTAENKGMEETQLDMEKYKYKIKCCNCGHSWLRRRKVKLVKHPDWFRCPCGGELIVEDVLHI